MRNPLSQRPSSAFSGIYYKAEGDYKMAIYDGADVPPIETDRLGKLPTESARLSQSVDDPSAENLVSIDFATNNPLPPTAAVIVTVPSVITQVDDDPSTC